jgi:methylated-DNA-[protein]-cysteine S-methyltransferase
MAEQIASSEAIRVAGLIRKKFRGDGSKRRGEEDDSRAVATKVYCTSFESKIGRIYVASTDRGVCKISVPRESRKDFFEWLKKHFDVDAIIDNRSKNKEVVDQLNRYFNGKLAKFTVPVDLIGTPFQLRVWRELSRIPYGITSSYKHVSRKVSAPKGFQAVGRAAGQNPLPIIIPCHRVLGANGAMVGYSCGVKTKELLLRLEGAIII